jgi:pyrimidine operon attenuation protein / uracil phosphoribosyltransferase
MSVKNYILSQATAAKKIERMALEIAERNSTETELYLLGIVGNGLVLANLIAKSLQAHFSGAIHIITVTLNKKLPSQVTLSNSIDFTSRAVILIDDVANSGKTMLYAIKPLLQYQLGKLQTLALVQRTHKQFPVAIDFVGFSLSTNLNEHIVVEEKNGQILGAILQQ